MNVVFKILIICHIISNQQLNHFSEQVVIKIYLVTNFTVPSLVCDKEQSDTSVTLYIFQTNLERCVKEILETLLYVI